MDQRSPSTPPLNIQFEVVQTLYRLVSEALTPTYQIKKHLLPITTAPHQPVGAFNRLSMHCAASSDAKWSEAARNGMATPVGESIKLFKASIAQQHQMLDQNLEFVSHILGRFEHANITPFILDVCPTIRDITPKPQGTGLLKAMGVLSGLALALALEKKGDWEKFKAVLDKEKKSHAQTDDALNRLLELAKRHTEDRLLSDVSARIIKHSSADIANILLGYTKMSRLRNTTTCRLYLEEFIPVLLWPIYPVQEYLDDQKTKTVDQKTKVKRWHPSVEVIADRLFGRESAMTLFAGGDSSKSWDDAGRGFATVLFKTVTDRSSTLIK
ncbi:MAG: hypothetical protein OJI67_18300 [Prosthecobacter sp.]|nr:hypothetical protein [Prosthecobacter sp.]